MSDPREGPKFALEPLARFRTYAMEGLQGNPGAPVFLRQINRSHPAMTEKFHDLVATNLGAWQ
jgi:hypothetical protein